MADSIENCFKLINTLKNIIYITEYSMEHEHFMSFDNIKPSSANSTFNLNLAVLLAKS